MNAASIVLDGVYVDATLTRWRRVVTMMKNTTTDETYVTYSRGTDTNGFCLLRTFARWACKRITVDADGMIDEYEEEPCQSITS